MRIIRTPEDKEKERIEREKANEGCDVCPCCGKIDKIYVSIDDGNKCNCCKCNIESIGKVDSYICYHCGAEWESEVYGVKRRS